MPYKCRKSFFGHSNAGLPDLWKHFVTLLSNFARHTPKQVPVLFASPVQIQAGLIFLQPISRGCVQDKHNQFPDNAPVIFIKEAATDEIL